MVELLFIRELAVSPQVLWPWVSDAAHISQWAAVTITPLTPGQDGLPDGIGATRQVQMGALRMEERIVDRIPEERLVYSVYKGGALRWHEATISLTATEEGTRLTWSIALQPAVPGTGWLMRRTLSRQFETGLATLHVMATP